MDKMKILCIVLLNYAFVHQVNGAGVTSITDPFECAQFLCDQNQGHDCSDGSTFFEGEDEILLCTPNTGYCSLKRLRNLDGSFAFRGECLDECDDEFTDYTVPNALHRCCGTHQCNLDVTNFPTDCTDDDLPTIFKGNFTAVRRNFDDRATASCEAGYKVTGGSEIACLANGTWTLSTADCQRLTCDLNLLPVLANGIFTATNHNSGDQATATCNYGFELTGADTIDCQENETWSQSTAGCQQIKCNLADLPAVQNGSYDAVSNNMGDEAKLTCDTGHYANATSTLVCQQNKTWTEPNNAAFCLQATACDLNLLPVLANGIFTATNHNSGDQATATCNYGFELTGADTIDCQENEMWSQSTAGCQQIKCNLADLPAVQNGSYDAVSNNMGDEAKLTCDTGHYANATSTLVCQQNKTWTEPNNAAFCLQATACDLNLLPVLANGIFTATNHNSGDQATATCNYGFELTGADTIDCQENEMWSQSTAGCQQIKCNLADLPAVQNGSYDAVSNNMGDEAKLTCDTGHYANATSTLVCQQNKTWTEPNNAAFCLQATACDLNLLPVLANGIFTATNHNSGDQATATCNYGFELTGADTIDCQENEMWSQSTAGCQQIKCNLADLPAVQNGSYDAVSNNMGDEAKLTCDTGHYANATSTLVCQQNKTWTEPNNAAFCLQATACDLNLLPVLANGIFTATNHNSGDQATATCNYGFELTGADTIDCQENEMWSQSTAGCQQIKCNLADLPAVQNGSYDAVSNNMGDEAKLTCDTGHYANATSTLVCQQNKTWTEPNNAAFCLQATACDLNLLPVLANGIFTATNHNSGDQATATCNYGFELTGADTIDCQENEMWSQSTAGCQQIKCNLADLPAVQNGSYDAVSNNMGDEAKLTCDTGHYANATSTLVCQQNKTWTEPNNAAFCLQATACDLNLLPVLANGIFTATNHNSGDQATATCNYGFELTGADTIDCQENEMWSQSTAGCQQIKCNLADLPAVQNGSYDAVSNNMGDEAKLTCDTGHYANATSTLVCQQNKTWTEPNNAAFCLQATDCTHNPLPTVSDGVFLAISKNFGDTAKLTCAVGHTLNGTETIMCRNDGTWESPSGTCEEDECNLADLPAVQNGSYDAVSNNMGDEAKLTCDTGHYANATSTLVCQQNKTWTEPNNAAFCLQATDCTHNPLPTVSDGVFLAISKNFGDTAKLTCAVGHTLNGTETIMCRNDGTWESPSGTCEEDDNSSVDAPSNLSAGGLAGIACGSTAGLASLGSLAFLGLRRFKARQNEVQPIG